MAVSLGNSLNNPGNLRSNPGVAYNGEVTSPNSGFKAFSSMAYGFRAMTSNLYHYVVDESLDTINKIINTYAPASDGNNPVSYANTVSQQTGISADQVLTKSDFSSSLFGLEEASMLKIVRAMATIEQGSAPDEDSMSQGYNMFLSDQGLPT